MMSNTSLLLRLAAAAVLVLLAGCPLPTDTSGIMTISIANAINARTLVPGISMDAASWLIKGDGPDGAAFTRATIGGSVTVEKLPFGHWTVTVDGLNASGTVIGRGTDTAVVHTGSTTSLSITVRPLPGDGSLRLGVTWTASDVETASIEATLLSPAGDVSVLDFSVGSGSATYAGGAAAGYHTLALQLKDNGINVMGAVEVVRIVEGQETCGSFAFTNVNRPGGTLIVNITPEPSNPIPVHIEGVPRIVTRGRSFTAVPGADDGTTGVTWVWYLNGVSMSTGPSWTVPAGLATGYYRLDVTGFTADGKRAGSAAAYFQSMLLGDDFEEWAVGAYPGGGWYELWGGQGAAVAGGVAFDGAHSFSLTGYTGWVRADGFNLSLDGVDALSCRAAVMVPSGQATGAAFGFFKRLSSNTSTDFNSIHLSPGFEITANGSVGQGTGVVCQADTWYDITVRLNYGSLVMDVWINGVRVVQGLPARPSADSSIFFIGTTWSSSWGTTTAYFDGVSVY